MLDRTWTYAVLGANNNQDKYGYIVCKDLLDAWYHIIPINPYENNVLWLLCYPTLSDYQGTIDMVIFVVQPTITEKVLPEVHKLGIKKVRLQPWSESPASIAFCEKNNISYIHNACIMIQKNI